MGAGRCEKHHPAPSLSLLRRRWINAIGGIEVTYIKELALLGETLASAGDVVDWGILLPPQSIRICILATSD